MRCWETEDFERHNHICSLTLISPVPPIPGDYCQATFSNVKRIFAPPPPSSLEVSSNCLVSFLSFIVLHAWGCLGTLHKSFFYNVQRYKVQAVYDTVYYSWQTRDVHTHWARIAEHELGGWPQSEHETSNRRRSLATATAGLTHPPLAFVNSLFMLSEWSIVPVCFVAQRGDRGVPHAAASSAQVLCRLVCPGSKACAVHAQATVQPTRLPFTHVRLGLGGP